MRIYKYRDLSHNSDEEFDRLRSLLEKQEFWCAKPCELNDQTEFIWEIDYSLSDSTLMILADVLSQSTEAPPQQTMMRAAAVIKDGLLKSIAHPIFENMMAKCRAEIGLACFGTSNDNEVLWERYGGRGVGACVEVEVPDQTFNLHFNFVQYSNLKQLHVDQVLSSYLDSSSLKLVYEVALNTKPNLWVTEEEVRFLSKRQNVPVRITDSHISRLILGDRLSIDYEKRLNSIVRSLPYALSISKYGA
jgi:hypothetical protein